MTVVLADQEFIGRSGELQLFEDALEAAREGTPSVVLVGGDAGIGKSSLVGEAARRRAGRCLVAPCVRMGGDQIPLAPLMALLRRLQRSDPELLETAPLLRDWLDPRSTATVRHTDVLASVTDLVIAASGESPLLFVVEDVHWADAATWDLVEYLARNLVDEAVVVAATYRTFDADRDPELRRRMAELSRLPRVTRIVLDGWSTDEVARRIETMVGGPPSATLVSEVVRRGQGNPYFTQELVTACQADELLPDVVSDLLEADLQRLPGASRDVVSALAVVGRPADQDLVVAVAELDDDPERWIRIAIDAGLVTVEGDTYQVRHALVGEAAYQRLLPGERRRRHRLAAELLQARAPGSVQADRIGELAVHLDRAGDAHAAFTALLAAADAAESVAPAAALDHLLRAIELWSDVSGDDGDREIVDRLWQAAELANGTRGNELAVELAQRALDAGRPPRGWAWGHERLGRYLWSAGRVGDSEAEYQTAYDLVESSADDGHLGSVLAGLGQAELMNGNYRAAEACSRRALEHLPAPEPDPMAWVTASRVLGLVVSHHGEPDDGIALCRRSVDAAPSAHVRHLASVYLVLAQLAAGRYDDAASTALDAGVEAVRTGADRSFGGYLDALAGEALIRLGRWTEAERLLRRHSPGDTIPVGEVRLLIATAKLLVRRGDAAGAQALLTQAASIPVDAWHETYLIAAIADVELVAGRWHDAAGAAQGGLGSPAGSMLLWRARFTNLLVNAEVERLLDAVAARDDVDLDEAVATLNGLISQVRDDVAHHDSGQLAEVIAYLDHAAAATSLLTGSDADTWERVGDQWAALSDAWLTGLCRLREADAAAGAGEASRAEAALREAHAVAVRLGSPPLLAQVDALSRRTRISVDRPERVVVSGTTAERLGLTARETEVLMLVAGGETNREIGRQLYISEKTASVHVSNIMRKLGVTTRVEAAAVAQRLGLDESPADSA